MACIKRSLISTAESGLFSTQNFKKHDMICYLFNECRNKYQEYTKIVCDENYGEYIQDYGLFELHELDKDIDGLYKVSSERINNKIREYNFMSKTMENVYLKKKETMFKKFVHCEILWKERSSILVMELITGYAKSK